MTPTGDKQPEPLPWYLSGPAVFFGVTILSLLGGLVTFEYESENMKEGEEQPVAKQLKPRADDSSDQHVETISAYLNSNFGTRRNQPVWYKKIKSVEKEGSVALITTDLPMNGSGKSQAGNICAEMSRFIESDRNEELGLRGVKVTTDEEDILMAKTSRMSSCE